RPTATGSRFSASTTRVGTRGAGDMGGSRQTILGAGGVIGRELARILPEYADHVRLVSRNPRAVTDGNETRSADLLDRDEVIAAVKGSTVAYLVAGLPYKAKVWQEQWPRIMANV